MSETNKPTQHNISQYSHQQSSLRTLPSREELQQYYHNQAPPSQHRNNPIYYKQQHEPRQQNTFGTSQRLYPASAMPTVIPGDRQKGYPPDIMPIPYPADKPPLPPPTHYPYDRHNFSSQLPAYPDVQPRPSREPLFYTQQGYQVHQNIQYPVGQQRHVDHVPQRFQLQPHHSAYKDNQPSSLPPYFQQPGTQFKIEPKDIRYDPRHQGIGPALPYNPNQQMFQSRPIYPDQNQPKMLSESKSQPSRVQQNPHQQVFSTLPSARPIPAPRKAAQRAPMRRQNSFSGFPLSSQSSSSIERTILLSGSQQPPTLQNPLPKATSANAGAPTLEGKSVNSCSKNESSNHKNIQSADQKSGIQSSDGAPIQPLRTTSLRMAPDCANKNLNKECIANNNSDYRSTEDPQHSHTVINIRNDLSKTNLVCTSSLAPPTSLSDQFNVVSTVTSHYANAIQSLRSGNNNAPPKPDLVSNTKDQVTNSSTPTTSNAASSSIASSGTGTKVTSSDSPSPAAGPSVVPSSSTANSKKKELRSAPGLFYSLPRHATTSSNPSLMRASASGLGLYFMSRRETNSAAKDSAAKQLGVSIPSGSNKFRSLPRPTKTLTSVAKSQGYQSLPRPSKVLTSIAMLSLPPEEKAVSTSSKLSSSNSSKKVQRDQKDLGDGKELSEGRMVRRHTEQVPSKHIYKDIDLKYQSLPRKKDMEVKQLSLPKKIPKELKEIDAKYQSLPKKKSKDSEQKYQSLPKRSVRDGDRHSSSTRRNKDSEGRHSSSKRSGNRESDGKHRRESRSPPGYNKPKRNAEGPRSPRWIPTDSDEDEIHSSVKSRDDSSLNSSIQETPYSRPLPPLPAPSRYRRRTADKENSSPPLPPPRISTASRPNQDLQNERGLPIADQNLNYSGVDDVRMPSIGGDGAPEGNQLPVTSVLNSRYDYSNDSGYHPPPPRIPPPKVPKSEETHLNRDISTVCKSSMVPMRQSPQGGMYPQNSTIDNVYPSQRSQHGGYPHPISVLTLPYPGSHGYRGTRSSESWADQLPPGATYPRNHQASRMNYPNSSANRPSVQYPSQPARHIPVSSNASNLYKFHYLDMVQHDQISRGSLHTGLPSSAIPLPGLSAGFTPGGFASSRAMFSGIPRDSVSGIPPPLDPPPKIPNSDSNQKGEPQSLQKVESPLYASDPLYETPQIPHVPGGVPVYPAQHQREQQLSQNRRHSDSRTPSPDNFLTRTEPSGEEDHYSSILSLMSTTPETPSVHPRTSWPNRVSNSASWDSIGSSGFSSMGSSQGLSGNTSSSRESAAARKRRRARSDPRMDAGVLNRLGFSACSSSISFEKEVLFIYIICFIIYCTLLIRYDEWHFLFSII